MPFVIGNETFEKLGTLGTSTNLLVYFTTVFNLKSISATLLINIFNAAIAKLHPPHCETKEIGNCPGPTPWQMAFLLSSLGLLVVGAGGIRPCNLAFGVDQFNANTESGKRGISSFFNWYYFTFTFAMMVIVAAVKKRQLKVPSTPSFLTRTSSAAIRTPEDQLKSDGSAANPWRLCRMQQVEQVKCVMRVIPIWVSASVYCIVLVQQQTYAVFQALQFDRRLGNTNFDIPAASYTVFNMLALTIWIPIYDRIIVPMLRRFTGKEVVEERRRTLALINPVGIDPRRVVHRTTSGAATGQRLPQDLNKGRLDYFYYLIAAIEALLVEIIRRLPEGVVEGWKGSIERNNNTCKKGIRPSMIQTKGLRKGNKQCLISPNDLTAVIGNES
ncbi:hypothetical protein SO802_020637 [Lithocarpus litseifolius]|uniref:Uncharacterized protein n=1 Tax=Lithocarpus litseifolius TaxID=425828 RepID=A0AAW2CDP1_9ROSI